MAGFCTLYSGSSGNSTLVSEAGRGILIDVGVSCRAVKRALESFGWCLEQMEGILLTHEHIDHIKGLRVLTKNYKIPVYGSPGTLRYIQNNDLVAPGTELIELKGPQEVMGMLVTPFPTSHDSVESVGFHIDTKGGSIGVATDLGKVDGQVEQGLMGCELVMLESNYDQRMLACGAYPYYLKRRIAGNSGHLSNDDCSAFLPRLVQSGTKHFVLCHLSRENNLPQIAEQSAVCQLTMEQMAREEDYRLSIAPRDMPGIPIAL